MGILSDDGCDGESDYDKKVRAKGEQLLTEVNESFIFTSSGHTIREIPTFRPEEISLGRVLGTGGFAVVQEVRKFTLDSSPRHEVEENETEETHEAQDESTNGAKEVQNDTFEEARRFMVRHVMRNGEARYAVKRMRSTLTKVEFARGMLDLAIEARYLQVLSHPGIIKLRGFSSESPLSRDFFIILDRLHDILDVRMVQWKKRDKSNKGFMLGLGKKKQLLRELLIERLTVAYDLAAAFCYLHDHRIVYRDIKPENIVTFTGFDVRDDVKVFDYGLCKSLSPKLKAEDGYGYRLTGRAGSIPYMAPEVVKMETYDTKCDVFSFAILLWEMIALKPSFQGMEPTDFVHRVCVNKEREPIPRTCPLLTRQMLRDAWDEDPRHRPDMKRVAAVIREDLNDMTRDEAVLDRTRHMNTRSDHSVHLELKCANSQGHEAIPEAAAAN